jgi:hypothetical protein
LKIFYLNISKRESVRFSKITKDKNPIHIDKQVGLDSVFKKNICHGVLLILKILNKINNIQPFLSCNYSVFIKFIKPIFFDEKILINYRHNFSEYNFIAKQNNQKICEIKIKDKNNKNINMQNFNFYKKNRKFFFKFRNISVYKFRNELKNLQNLLCNISFYVGMIKPGKNGILNSIEINKFNAIQNKFSQISINTKKIDRRYNLYNNELIYKKYIARFVSSERPEYKIVKHKNNKKLKKIINKVCKDVIIISGSSGLGESFLNIIKDNKKIKIISTYSKQKPKKNLRKNILFKKISFPKDLLKLIKIIKKLNYPYVFYFTSPSINFGKNLSAKNKILYKQIFVKIPVKILYHLNRNISKFIYPSTTNIDYNINATYSKVKLEAEKELKKFSSCYIHRFDKLYSKNTVSLYNYNIINIQKLLNQKPELLYKFFK